jgi:phenylacetate-CoA ligase
MCDKRLSGNYQIVLSRDGHLDQVEVRCELQREVSDQVSESDVTAIGKALQHHIKTNIGISTRITVLKFNSIERTLAGKARRLFDERPKLV